jgi:hypothetical protein
LAYVQSRWNFADLNTKAVTPEIFRRLSSFILNGIHDFKWKQEAGKTLIEIWQQCKARDDSREMEKHVKQFGETRKEQRAKATAKERSLLNQEMAPALKANFVSQEASTNRSPTSGGVRYTIPVNGISSEEAMQFGLDKTNPGFKMMCDMGWRGGALGKQNNGIATAITGKSIGGQTNKSGLGSHQQFDSRTSVMRRKNKHEYENKRDTDRQSRKRESKQFKEPKFVCRITTGKQRERANKRKR